MHLVQRNAESWGETSSAGVHKGTTRRDRVDPGVSGQATLDAEGLGGGD